MASASLVARERSGHTAVLEENMLYVWGGYMSVADDEVFLPNDEIWVYDIQRGVWEVFHMTGEVPPSMSGTCGCSLNGHMYIFGGCDDNGQTNQIYCVDLTDAKYMWSKIIHEIGAAPSPRDKLSCWVYNGSCSFCVQGRAPAPRAAHASATVGCRGYICGGRVMETRTNDIHCLDLESWTWSEIIPVSTTPVGRSWHTLTTVSDSTLFLFGGLSVDCKPMSKKLHSLDYICFFPSNDLFMFLNITFMLWHTACPGKDSDVIVFGGSCDYILLVDTNLLLSLCDHFPKREMRNDFSHNRICEDYIAKNVRTYEMLRNQLSLLPSKLLTAIQRRMSFYRPSKKQKY
uniref:Uncharacterized protein n=1 Tax=Monopterus albus TaxID=43700 RepID=A0A3Q3JZA2_MONAL